MRGGRFAVALVAVAVAGCNGGSTPSPSPTPDLTPIARVGSIVITQSQFDVRMQGTLAQLRQAGGATPSAMVAATRARVMKGLIEDALVAQEAEKLGVGASDSEISHELALDRQSAGGSQQQLESQLASAGETMAQLEDETVASLNDQHVEQVFAQQRANDVLTQLAGGAPFASLATQYSDDTQTAASGGDLGVMSQAALAAGDPAFKAAVLALQAGQTTTKPVRDAAGFEVLRVSTVTAAGPHVFRILVAAPQPYTIQDRPQWYDESLLLELSDLCAAKQVVVYIDAGNQPCTAATPAPGASASAKP